MWKSLTSKPRLSRVQIDKRTLNIRKKMVKDGLSTLGFTEIEISKLLKKAKRMKAGV